ncbi:MAG TPA: NADH-quinone oxidoreductase subunit N [Cyclobacteriaceae bacterium]|jgi:NADH-quinone oxidoreductase subunit N|nr:NADH-quinone oxidoreductase subunit N [Cyclobacteriaceae bacterium]
MNALYIICGLGFAALLTEIFSFRKALQGIILTGLVAAFIAAAMDWHTAKAYFNNMVLFDQGALSFTLLLIFITACWFWINRDYFEDQLHQTDRSALILFSLSGGVMMSAYHNMAMLFLGIEVLSISLYVLAGSRKESLLSNESAFKYFIMGSFATGFLLMGIALVYGATGTFDISVLATKLGEGHVPEFVYPGILLILVGMLFKISAVPFHFWAPDVYDGAPVPITAYMATVVKTAAVAAFWRMFAIGLGASKSTWIHPIEVVTVLTLVIPSVIAVYQTSLKRMMAWSSVGQIGYLLLAFISQPTGTALPVYYLLAYGMASLIAFAVVVEVEKADGPGAGVNGLFKRHTGFGVLLTLSLLSLAGIPPLAGFMAKYQVLVSAVQADHIGLTLVAVLSSLIGVFYYLRVIVLVFSNNAQQKGKLIVSPNRVVLLAILAALILMTGLLPDSLLSLLSVRF